MNLTRWTGRTGAERPLVPHQSGSDRSLLPLQRATSHALEPRRSAIRRALAPVASVLCLSLAGCLSNDAPPPPVNAIPTSAAACEALRPGFPVKLVAYDSIKDTPETVADVKASNVRAKSLNARFATACP